MKDESLGAALEAIIVSIDKLDIDRLDKLEILLNLRLFLDPEKYEDNRDTLKRYEREKRGL